MKPACGVALALLLGAALGGCGALQRLSEVGRPPEMTPSSDPTKDPSWRPMSMPMPALSSRISAPPRWATSSPS
jgi:flagellar L-ring protein precursor FlgH